MLRKCFNLCAGIVCVRNHIFFFFIAKFSFVRTIVTCSEPKIRSRVFRMLFCSCWIFFSMDQGITRLFILAMIQPRFRLPNMVLLQTALLIKKCTQKKRKVEGALFHLTILRNIQPVSHWFLSGFTELHNHQLLCSVFFFFSLACCRISFTCVRLII